MCTVAAKTAVTEHSEAPPAPRVLRTSERSATPTQRKLESWADGLKIENADTGSKRALPLFFFVCTNLMQNYEDPLAGPSNPKSISTPVIRNEVTQQERLAPINFGRPPLQKPPASTGSSDITPKVNFLHEGPSHIIPIQTLLQGGLAPINFGRPPLQKPPASTGSSDITPKVNLFSSFTYCLTTDLGSSSLHSSGETGCQQARPSTHTAK
jgi:hypothetical protein